MNTQGALGALGAFHALRAASGPLLTQALLHAQLAQIEWAEERRRWEGVAIAALVAFAFLVSLLVSAGGLLVAWSWNTDLRIPTCAGVGLFYLAGTSAALWKLRSGLARGSESFAALREELAADAALIESQL